MMWLLLAAGLVALYFGAEWLVRGSASLALRLGLTPLVVGLTVVAYGTSAPELVVSARAAWDGHGAIAIGNVVGSNIFNIAVILGLAAVICPLRVQFQLIKLDTPIMIFVSALFLVLFWDGTISRVEAGLLLLGALLYAAGNIYLARREATAQVEAEFAEAAPRPSRHWSVDAGFIVLGLITLVAGSRLFVSGAVSLAKSWGVSDAVIGLTIVAAGTSLPELATSAMAAWRRQPDIALGNVIGSNVYNVLGILGVAGLVRPLEGTGVAARDVYVMTGLAVVLLPLMRTGLTVTRTEGALLLAAYGGYLAWMWPK
jgi:cation:H+ antiporter